MFFKVLRFLETNRNLDRIFPMFYVRDRPEIFGEGLVSSREFEILAAIMFSSTVRKDTDNFSKLRIVLNSIF